MAGEMKWDLLGPKLTLRSAKINMMNSQKIRLSPYHKSMCDERPRIIAVSF